jgi:hypothetical protein
LLKQPEAAALLKQPEAAAMLKQPEAAETGRVIALNDTVCYLE